MKFRKKYLIVLLILLLLVCAAFVYYVNQKPDLPFLTADENADDWDGEHDLYKKQSEIPSIAIPGIDTLVFKADSTEQKVNFHNPKDNTDILFLMTLYVEDKEYWHSGYVESGKGYYDITLSEPIEKGEYNAFLSIQCFKSDGTALNSANVDFNLYVE